MRVRLSFTAVVALLVLAACGGGGSSSPGSVSVPPPVNDGVTQQSVQRADSQDALVGVEGYQEFTTGGESALAVGPTMHRLVRKIGARSLLGRRDTSTGCEAGSSGGGVEITTTQTGADTETVTIQEYYDAACTELESTLNWTATISSSATGYTIAGPATFSEYAEGSSTVTESANAQIAFYENSSETLTGISILLTGITIDGNSAGSLGVACTETGATACGLAMVTSGNSEVGALASMTLSGSSVSMQISQYAGSSLTIAPATLPDWTISPASDQTQSVSISGSASGSGFTLTMTDSQNGGTYTIDGSSSGTVTGTLVVTGTSTTEASFTLNAAGNGTVTFSNGTTANVVDYVIES
jgi:hypothetical protein